MKLSKQRTIATRTISHLITTNSYVMHTLKDHKPKLSLWNIILDFNLKINKLTTITDSNKTSKLRECQHICTNHVT